MPIEGNKGLLFTPKLRIVARAYEELDPALVIYLNNFGPSEERVSLVFSRVKHLVQVVAGDGGLGLGHSLTSQHGFIY
jgi:hypothetical protein